MKYFPSWKNEFRQISLTNSTKKIINWIENKLHLYVYIWNVNLYICILYICIFLN